MNGFLLPFFIGVISLVAVTAHHMMDGYVCCDSAQEPVGCPNDCNARTCASLKQKIDFATCNKACYTNKCQCKAPLYMNACGKCVPKEKCDNECNEIPPTCPGKDEELVACFRSHKARICKNARPSMEPSCKPDSPFGTELFEPTYTEAGAIVDHCIENICDCKRNFYRNKCGICVKKSECEKPCRKQPCDKCSDPHEMRYKRWMECDQRTCTNLEDKMSCHVEVDKVFRNQCDCRPGWYRDACGRCVPKSECTRSSKVCKCSNPCPEGKVLACINSCSRKTCNRVNGPFRNCQLACHNACDCKGNTWLNRDGDCVKKDKCTQEDVDDTGLSVLANDIIQTPDPEIANDSAPVNASEPISPKEQDKEPEREQVIIE